MRSYPMSIRFPNPFSREASFDRLLVDSRARADTIMSWMCTFLFIVCFAVHPVNETLDALLIIGMPTFFLAWWFSQFYAGRLIIRIYMSSAFMVFTGLLIHQLAGDIEAHVAAFGLIGVLLFYRDWRCIAAATMSIYLHHLILGYAQTQGVNVFVFDDTHFWELFGQLVAYFLPFVGMMGFLSIWLRVDTVEKA